jgi:class 3 adenylate cyclase/tetratricopeptide (TPR) repeat protein
MSTDGALVPKRPERGIVETRSWTDRGDGTSRFRSVTLLISDMVGSTDVRVRLGADGERLVRLHDALAREAVASLDGTFIKGLGDGTMAVFDAAADAVSAAVRLQRQIAALHQRGEAGELQVRVGISAGDVSIGPEDCYGLPVAEAVRLCGAAAPGEILVADVVRALARRLEAPLSAVGELTLKGLGEPVVAWRVDWAPQATDWEPTPLPPRLAEPVTGPLVGRETEVAGLLRTARKVLSGEGRRWQLVTGEPGAGKTALVAEVARRLHAEGAVVLHGGCDEELRPPYQPFVQALRHLVRTAPTNVLDDYVRRHGGDLAVLIPELEDRVGRLPAPRSTAQSADRYLLFTAVTALLDTALAHAPIVLVLDDVQWADPETLLLLRHVLSGTDLSRLAVISTLRNSDLDAGSALPDLVAELRRVGCVERLDLLGLGEADLRAIAEQLLGTSPAAAAVVARVVRKETDGNAFFAIEMLRHLRETRDELGQELLNALPPSVRDVVRSRVRRLGDDVEQLLTAGAVLGAEFGLAVVADIAGMPTEIALDLLERATQAALLREVPGRSRFRFVHALVQHSLYDELSHARRRWLHRAAAEAMERAGEPGAAAVASHWLAAGDMGERLRAMAACTAAADEAVAQRAPDEAARWYLEALDLAPDDDELVRCELLLRLGEAQRLGGDPVHRQTLLEAAACARAAGDADRLARAALGRTRWFSSFVSSGGDAEQLALLDDALQAVGDSNPGVQAQLLATLTAELVYTDRTQERFATAERALELAKTSGDPAVLFDVLFWRAMAARAPGRGESEPELAELRAIAAALNDPLRRAMADVITVLRGFVVGNLARGQDALQEATQLADELHLPVLQWLMTVLRATEATVSARLDEGERLVFEALELSQATDQPDTSTWFGVQLYMLRFEQGRLGELRDLFAAALARAPRLYTWHAALAMALTELGDLDGARALIAQMCDADYPHRPGEPHWLIGMCCMGTAAAAVGDAETAATVYAALAPYANTWASIMPLSLGSTHRVLGELALCMDRLDDAETHLRAAIASNDAGPAPAFAARARVALIATLLRQRRDAEIQELVDAVTDAVTRYGLARVEQMLHAVVDDVRGASADDLVPPQPSARPVVASGLLHVDEPRVVQLRQDDDVLGLPVAVLRDDEVGFTGPR